MIREAAPGWHTGQGLRTTAAGALQTLVKKNSSKSGCVPVTCYSKENVVSES